MHRLRLQRKHLRTTVTGLGGTSSGKIYGSTDVKLKSRASDFTLPVSALIIKKITNNLPHSDIAIAKWPHTNDIQLADPDFHQSGPIDVLLGADFYHEIVET